jgi:hypothetical protein
MGRRLGAFAPNFLALAVLFPLSAKADGPEWEDADPDTTQTEPAPETPDEPAPPPAAEPPAQNAPAPKPSSTTKVEPCPAPPVTPAARRPLDDVAGAVELSYGKMVLPTGRTTFGATGFPDKTGRELGFENPLLNYAALRGVFQVDSHLVGTFGMAFAWGRSDTDGTDPQGARTTGWMYAADLLDVGLAGVTRSGPFVLSGGATTGPRVVMIGMDYYSQRSNAVAAFQWYLRPRVSLALDLDDNFALGVYASDDILRTNSVGAGIYASFQTADFGAH